MKGSGMKLLSRAEELVLLAVWGLQENAYGVAVRKYIIRVTETEWSIGAIYVPLDRLTREGFLEAIQGEPTPERGGRRKRFYRLTPKGIEALERLRSVQERLWSKLPGMALNGESTQ
jgi:DNA-binding PadR family transcriptional regulator